ncbi:MAG: helix-turn-helix domain-containing protein [Flavobacteriia bacterium]|nr:helix-turn-helix domain-containing protein [Flavobacteriia bacterium]
MADRKTLERHTYFVWISRIVQFVQERKRLIHISLIRLDVMMNTSTSDDPRPDRPRLILGHDVNRIRAAFNLLREEFADAIGVSVPTLTRWERQGPTEIRARGHPGRLMAALRDRIVIEGVPLADARTTGRYVSQCLLRHGRLEAAQELIRFAGRRTLRRFLDADEE